MKHPTGSGFHTTQPGHNAIGSNRIRLSQFVSDSAQLMAAASAGVGAKFLGNGANFTTEFKGQTQAVQRNAYEQAQKYADNHNLRESLSKLSFAIADGSYETSDRAGQELHSSVRTDLAKSQDLAEASSLHYGQANSLRQSIAESESSGGNVHGSLNQRLFETLAEQRTQTGGIIGTEQARALLNSMDPNDRRLVNAVANQIVEEEVERIKTHTIPSGDLQQTFFDDQQAFKQAHSPENFYNQHEASTKRGKGVEGKRGRVPFLSHAETVRQPLEKSIIKYGVPGIQ